MGPPRGFVGQPVASAWLATRCRLAAGRPVVVTGVLCLGFVVGPEPSDVVIGYVLRSHRVSSSSTRSAIYRSSKTPVLPGGLIALRTRLPDPHQQPVLQRLGRRIRRPKPSQPAMIDRIVTTPMYSPSKGPATDSAGEGSTAFPASAAPPNKPRPDCRKLFTIQRRNRPVLERRRQDTAD